MISVDVAKPHEFKSYFGFDPPDVWTALVGRQGNTIIGMGGVIYDEWGRAFGFLDTSIRSFTLHRQAIRFLKALRETGEPAVYTFCERSQSARAEVWLKRLGFAPDEEMQVPGQDVWKWTP